MADNNKGQPVRVQQVAGNTFHIVQRHRLDLLHLHALLCQLRRQGLGELNVVAENLVERAVSEVQAQPPIDLEVLHLRQVGHLDDQLLDGLQADKLVLVVALLDDERQVGHDGVAHLRVVEPAKLDYLREQENHHADDRIGPRQDQTLIPQVVDAILPDGHLLLGRDRAPVVGEQRLHRRGGQILAAGALRVLEEVLELADVAGLRVERLQFLPFGLDPKLPYRRI